MAAEAGAPESAAGRDKRRFQRSLFDAISGQYDAYRPRCPAQAVAFAVRTAGLCPGAAVLEIGCGTGQLTRALAGSGMRVTAIDIGPSMTAAARRSVTSPDVSFQVTSFEELHAADASFGMIISAAAFHWIDPGVAYVKSARLLRPGGWLAVLGTEEHYDEPLAGALTTLWLTHGDTGGAWETRSGDSRAAGGLFGPPAQLTVTERAVLPAAGVLALESTRATFLSWPPDTQRRFEADLRRLLGPLPRVPLTRRTSVTMTQVLPGRG